MTLVPLWQLQTLFVRATDDNGNTGYPSRLSL